MLRTIEIDQDHNRDNNSAMRDPRNTTTGLRFSNISSGENNKDNTRVNNLNNNPMREFNNNHKDKRKDLRFSKHNTLNLKENLRKRSELEKAGRIEVRGNTTISSNDI